MMTNDSAMFHVVIFSSQTHLNFQISNLNIQINSLTRIVYDVSLRVPGNPIVATTSPYTKYQYGQTFGVGRRIAMEIKRAQEEGRLDEIVT